MSSSKPKIRKAPAKSATIYPVGTKMLGQDNNMWIIVKTANDVKRWSKIVTSKTITKPRNSKANNKSKTKSKPKSKSKPKPRNSRTNSKSKSKSKSKKTNSKKRCNTSCSNKSWDAKLKQRRKELINMTNTNTYMPRNSPKNKPRTYLIHDNGGRPFLVVANKKAITVYTDDNYNNFDRPDEKLKYETECVKFTKFQGYWSGLDSSPNKMHGNSILVKINDHKYVFIGLEIYSFETKDVIQDYISPVGNSDVPYPVAYGKDNVYFLIDNSYMDRKYIITEATVANAVDIYMEFYGHINGDAKGRNNRPKHKIKNKKVIQKRL